MKIFLAVACFFAAVLILLFVPVVVRFSYKKGEMRAYVRYLFIKIDFFPKKAVRKAAKKAEKEAKKEYSKQKKEEESPAKKPAAVIDTAKTVWSAVKAAKWGLNLIRKSLLFYGVRIHIRVGGPDAHQTAVKYGQIGAAVHFGMDIFKQLFRLREPDVRLAPDFLSESTYINIAFKMRLRPIIAVIALSHALIHFLRAQSHNKKKRKYVKGVRKHESAASR